LTCIQTADIARSIIERDADWLGERGGAVCHRKVVSDIGRDDARRCDRRCRESGDA
jgi:hypothetical protein